MAQAIAFNKLTPNLMVEDVDASVDFYTGVLGFERVMSVPEERPYDWVLVQRGGVELMFQTRASLAEELPAFADKPIDGALVLYVEVDGVEALYERIQSRVTVVKEPHDTFYGAREFAIEDGDGFVVVFAEHSE